MRYGYLFLFVILLFGGCSDSGSGYLFKIDGGELKKYLVKNRFIHRHTPVYSIKVYKISYLTKDSKGELVRASGVMTVPVDSGVLQKFKKDGLSVVLDFHPTIFSNEKAPSVYCECNGKPTATATLFSAMRGFVTLQPDYVGFGDSVGHYHPYLVRDSAVTSTKDFLKASIKFAKEHNIGINFKELYITGFSQGGYNALQVSKALQKEYEVRVVAPIAGSYLLDNIANAKLKELNRVNSLFLLSTIYAYNKRYKIDMSKFIVPNFIENLDGLLDKSYNKSEIVKLLPSSKNIFKNKLYERYQNSRLQTLLKENSKLEFNRSVDIELFYCKGDRVVKPSVAYKTYSKLALNGVDVKIFSVEDKMYAYRDMNHRKCGYYGYFLVSKEFEKLRDLEKGN